MKRNKFRKSTNIPHLIKTVYQEFISWRIKELFTIVWTIAFLYAFYGLLWVQEKYLEALLSIIVLVVIGVYVCLKEEG